MKILITSAAGFIGFHAVEHFVKNGNCVVGLDNINIYYNVDLKYDRLKETGISKALIQKHKAIKRMLEMLDGDVFQTYADTRKLENDLNYKPETSIQGGINRLYDWYIFSSLRKEVNMIRISRFVMRK